MRNKINKRNPPPPKIRGNQQNPSLLGNVMGGITSGFGLGTGIEAARGIFGSRSSSNEISGEKNNNCEMLFKLVEICEKKDNSNCEDLFNKFSKNCLN